MKINRLYWLCLGLLSSPLQAQMSTSAPEIPAVYQNIKQDESGKLYVENAGKKAYEIERPSPFTLQQAQGSPRGTEVGIAFDFGENFAGTLYYGFIPQGDSKHPLPVYFKRPVKIEAGKAEIDVKNQLRGKYDMVGWQEAAQGTLGYRVMTEEGLLVYDGKVTFKGTGPFEVATSIIEGPFVNLVTEEGVTISFTSNQPVTASVRVGEKTFSGSGETTQHEIKITGLEANQAYDYTVICGDMEQTFAFRTAPKSGSRTAFTFAYASDSRNGQGGGERNLYGANFYIMKKIMALAKFQKAAFFQFSGDLINGYLTNPDEMHLQYANWKRAVEPFGHYFPIYKSMGNHEALMRVFSDGSTTYSVDRFPFESESAEVIFAQNFVNPKNGPASEDGAAYDPNPEQIDFPSYEENVFYYTYDNVAVLVLNSDYFYAPSTGEIPHTGGGLHAYIMDQQTAWVKETIQKLEADANIDHVFITLHTPFFPNGGHVEDDMWYEGNNQYRSQVAGKPLTKGIIERRDELLDLLVNQSQKVKAIMTGDEHNYAKTEIGPDTQIYPENYSAPKIKLNRTIYQINNGAAGAPYYAQEQTPWTPKVTGFTTQNALVFFQVEGKKLRMEVLNPDTLEKIDELEWK